jgi:branched-chain amino acid transport system ATP-binding protein
MSTALLSVVGLETGYGGAQVLFGVSFAVAPGEVVTLMGRNGMGKTTTIRAIFGLIKASAGQIVVRGRDLTGAAPHRVAQAGLGLVPEDRHIFPRLTVEENLVATASTRRGSAWTLSRIYELFPRLEERRANLGTQISGGEQQMLAIGRALMTNPSLLVLDEATEGLAPIVRAEIWSAIARLKREGFAILIVDKNVKTLMRIADRHVVMEKGRVAWQGTAEELVADPTLVTRRLEL